MAHINEFGEIIRDNDPNDRSQESISVSEGLMVFFSNIMFFIPGTILYNNHKKKGYTKKAKQIKTLNSVQLVFYMIFIIFLIIISGS